MALELVAEAAQGYEGDPTLARLLARGAVRAGADAVKFQLVYADDVSTPDYKHYPLYQQLEMPFEAWQRVAEEVKKAGARFYLDVGGERGLREARELGADGVKIHSTNFFNTALVRGALAAFPRVYVSFGGIAVEELAAFLDEHKVRPGGPVTLLYGFQADPTPLGSNHLRKLGALKARFPGHAFGFMDHTDGDLEDAACLAAMALPYGITCIEKHLGLDRALQIEDYVSALPPAQFQAWAARMRRLEAALGTDDLALTPLEQEYRKKVLKVPVALRPLSKGHVLTPTDVKLRRVAAPAAEGVVYRVEDVVGRRLAHDAAANQQLTRGMVA